MTPGVQPGIAEGKKGGDEAESHCCYSEAEIDWHLRSLRAPTPPSHTYRVISVTFGTLPNSLVTTQLLVDRFTWPLGQRGGVKAPRGIWPEAVVAKATEREVAEDTEEATEVVAEGREREVMRSWTKSERGSGKRVRCKQVGRAAQS